MTASVSFSDNWDAICTPRMGVAKLTEMAFQGQDIRSLWHELMDGATDDVTGSGTGMDLSVISQLLGDQPTGLAIQKDTLALQRLYRSPCATDKPRLRVLALAAVMDIGGNTPLEFLLQASDIELATFYVVPGMPLPDPMPDHDVAIVVAPDGDAAWPSMLEIQALVSAWPRPVLNLPENIGLLDRDRLYQRLKDVPGLEIPATGRVTASQLHELISDGLTLRDCLADGEFPMIIRPIGSHAGFGLAKVDDCRGLAEYLAAREETEFFISRFVDYSSADGNFRKYRIVMIDGKPYACHMAIAEEWKVWYLNADMAVSVPHRTEEATFMLQFDQEFAVRHRRALTAMASRIGLEYVAIDCAETRGGALLVFEADNTAIVHAMDPPSVYPYKPAQMQKIFKAVQVMFARRAGQLQVDAA